MVTVNFAGIIYEFRDENGNVQPVRIDIENHSIVPISYGEKSTNSILNYISDENWEKIKKVVEKNDTEVKKWKEIVQPIINEMSNKKSK